MSSTKIPEVKTDIPANQAQKIRNLKAIQKSLPKDITINFQDTNNNGVLDDGESFSYNTKNGETIYYSVKKGDTLQSIAKKFKTTLSNLTTNNQLKEKNGSPTIRTDSFLKITRPSSVQKPTLKTIEKVIPAPQKGKTKGALTEAETQEIIKYLKQEEGFSKVAYWDNTHWSIGYGTEAKTGECPKDKDGKVKQGSSREKGTVEISQEEAAKRMKSKIQTIEQDLIKELKGSKKEYNSLTKDQKMVLISLGYNIGIVQVMKSNFLKKVKNNNIAAAQNEIDWGIKEDNGLLLRRAKEMKMFGNGTLSPQSKELLDNRLNEIKETRKKLQESDKTSIKRYDYLISELTKIMA